MLSFNQNFTGFFLIPCIPVVVYFLDLVFLDSLLINFFDSTVYSFISLSGVLSYEFQRLCVALNFLMWPFLVFFWLFSLKDVVSSKAESLIAIGKLCLGYFFLFGLLLCVGLFTPDVDGVRKSRTFYWVQKNPILFHIFFVLSFHFLALFLAGIINQIFEFFRR